MGHLLGSEKNNFFNSRYCRSRHGGRVGGNLSIRGPEVSLGSPRVGTIHVHAPTPRTRALPSVDTYQYRSSAISGQSPSPPSFRSRAPRRAPRIGACGVGDYPTSVLSQRESASRSAPEKSKQFGPDGAPFPSNTEITRGPPVVAVAVSLDPILPHRYSITST